VEVPDELRRKPTERAAAKAYLAGAEQALQVLADDLADCRRDAERAARAARAAAVAVLAVTADTLAARHDELVAEAARIVRQLAAFDRWIAVRLAPARPQSQCAACSTEQTSIGQSATQRQ
jgi:hypothetical protein